MAGRGLLTALEEAVGPEHLFTAPDLVAPYCTDWTGRWSGSCTAVVRPASTGEVAAVVRACADAGSPIVPQGGNTGLVGATVPSAGAVVLSLRRLQRLDPVDRTTGQLTAGAGVTIEALHDHVRGSGWRYPVDFGARGSATVGGSIATNAGGHHVVRHGMTRHHLVGIEAVLADGRVVSHLGGLVKDNTGYDLAGLVCGSEGTLAVVTNARLALVPDASEVVTAMVALDGIGRAVEALGRLRTEVPDVEAIELMFADELASIAAERGEVLPVAATPATLLVECAGREPSVDRLGALLADLEGVVDTAVGVEGPRRAALWAWRDLHTEVINRLGATPPHKLDVTVPLDRLGEFVHEVRTLVAAHAPEARLWLFGHAGDGNLHVNVTGLDPDDEAVDASILRLVAALGGSISAEHGIGRAKRRWLSLTRSPEEIATFVAIKRALDPAGLLSPGVLLPEEAGTA